MSVPRRVEPELLDELPADDPRAQRSRRDLELVNAFMLQSGIMASSLLQLHDGAPPRTLIDLGGGDGTFMLSVARRLAPRWPGVAVTVLDRQDILSDKTRADFRALGWQIETAATDVFAFLERARPLQRGRHHRQPVPAPLPAGATGEAARAGGAFDRSIRRLRAATLVIGALWKQDVMGVGLQRRHPPRRRRQRARRL